MTVAQLTTFFGWMTVINIGIFALSCVLVLALRKLQVTLHTKMFMVSEEVICNDTYAFLGGWKLLIIVFNLVPYLTLVMLA